jgi:hypothetical protein
MSGTGKTDLLFYPVEVSCEHSNELSWPAEIQSVSQEGLCKITLVLESVNSGLY